MPPTRSSKRRAGGRTRTGATVAKKFLAACNGAEILPLSEHDQQVEYIEAAIQRLTQTGKRGFLQTVTKCFVECINRSGPNLTIIHLK